MNTYRLKLPLFALFFGLLLFCVSPAEAQFKKKTATLTYTKAGISLNELNISEETTIQEVFKKLGKKNRKQTFTETAAAYVFDKYGLIFYTENDKIQSIGISITPEAEEGGTTKTFNGSFTINDTVIDKNTAKEVLEGINNIRINCPDSHICTANVRGTKVNCLISYTDNGQIAFINLNFKIVILSGY